MKTKKYKNRKDLMIPETPELNLGEQQDRGRNKLNTTQGSITRIERVNSFPSLIPAELFQYESQRVLHPHLYQELQRGIWQQPYYLAWKKNK